MALAALCATHRALLPILSFAVFEPHYRSGAIPWCHIEKTFPIESIVDQKARQFRLKHRLAQRYVSEMLGMWRRLGLLDGERKHSALTRTSGPPRKMWNESEESPPASLVTIERWRHYRLIDTDFSLGFSDVLLEEIIAPVLLHLETPLSRGDAVQLRIVMEGGRLGVWHDGMCLGSCRTFLHLAPMIQGMMSTLALRLHRFLLALHAAGIGMGDSAMLLVASSASGKSTLAAALAATGWDYLSDDMILMQPQKFGRNGGALQPRRARPRHGFAKPKSVHSIVFLHRASSSAGSLRPLGKLQGIRILMQHCCGIPSALAPNDIRHLIAWSSGVRWISLEMSDLRTAVDSLTHLLTGAEAPTRSRQLDEDG
jgi:hypothetical protein